MNLFFPKYKDEFIRLKYSTLIIFSLFQLLVFALILIVHLISKLPSTVLYGLFITNVFFPVLIIFLARYNIPLASLIYTVLVFTISASCLLFIKTHDIGLFSLIITIMFITSILAGFILNTRISIIFIILTIAAVVFEISFGKNFAYHLIHLARIENLKIVFISIPFLLSIPVMVVSHTMMLRTILNKYNNEFEKNIKFENELLEKNTQLKALNSELEQNMALLEETNEQLEKTLNRAEESDKLKTSFLQNISHEIRTPMNAIVGFLNIIKERSIKKDFDQNEFINYTINAGHQLLNIINDVIELSQINAGIIKIQEINFNLNELINTVYQHHLTLCKKKEIEFILQNNITDLQAQIVSDNVKISQILNNLISNAIKFTNKGNVTLECNFENKRLQFYVKDTGIGIKAKDLNVIYDRFRQLEADTSMRYEGLGIGLSIVKEIINNLNGKITVESEYGSGTSFYVEIPVKTAEIELQPIDNYNIATPGIIKPKHINILIAEDDVTNFLYFDILLKKYENISVFHAWNGVEAIDICKQQPDIDIFLMDIKMPIMDGITAIQEIRKIRPGAKVIAVTAYAMNNEKERFANYGFNGYLTKPVKKPDLLKILGLE